MPEKLIGKMVKIQGNHPHSGKYGAVIGIRTSKMVNRSAAIIDVGSGHQCVVFSEKYLKVIG